MEQYHVSFYTKASGEKPAKDFISALEPKMRTKMLREITVLENNGPLLKMPDSRPLGDGIFELRAQVATDITRVLYFFYVGKEIVLTNGFVKKTQKTPPLEIKKAKAYRADYLARKEVVKVSVTPWLKRGACEF